MHGSAAMIPLQSSISVDDSFLENSIDFCRFEGAGNPSKGLVLTPPLQLKIVNETGISTNDWNSSTSAVFLVVSSSPRCGLVARFFCTRLLRYLRWCGESAVFFLSGPNERDIEVQRFEDDVGAWEKYVESCLEKSLLYLASNPCLGFSAIPVVILLTDCESVDAYDRLHGMLDSRGNFLVRHIWFDEDWKERASPKSGYINVCLKQPALRMTRSQWSIVCSRAAGYLNSCLPVLHRVYLDEPLVGSPEETLRSFSPLFFTRHGQSEYNLQDRLGGDPDLTSLGREDALTIAEFFKRQVVGNSRLFALRNAVWDKEEGFEVWCSQLKRTRRTAEPSARVLTRGELKTFKTLNEIHAGVCEDMTNEEIKALYPPISSFRHTDKVGFRYPNGESYQDLMRRLEPILLDLDATRKCVLVVAHQAVLRTALSFFDGPAVEEAVHTPCPHRSVWCCTYNRLGEPRLTTITLKPRKKNTEENSECSGW
ncbi:fructose-6-phosphate2-kinase/fructose-2 [Trypanosoma cruzi Dm28c]|uniref:Fructose-6-phosphate2-kinase/fructose-2 n=1 Tax=Trypanosoma cruzi Dm28c TaxID=1416333 RepID=V5C004_TRYCR|nr:fructose-6-phosphate2-kinase/fructose-2 [Trypanosoma cruzi Dm28c]KAF8289061.1 putative 6-phosphofructo-2-kinase/fructose-2,6-bisphosphatase [Trypanosoma cruzi]PBJ72022.1 putative fructose-6-phosphate2-kinase/fructose-2,6-bisphos phatase [Trypanosoma cruzi cruzi]